MKRICVLVAAILAVSISMSGCVKTSNNLESETGKLSKPIVTQEPSEDISLISS